MLTINYAVDIRSTVCADDLQHSDKFCRKISLLGRLMIEVLQKTTLVMGMPSVSTELPAAEPPMSLSRISDARWFR